MNTIASYIKAALSFFFTPQGIDSILGEFIVAQQRLENLVLHHDTRSDHIQDRMDTLRADQYVHDQAAARAEGVAFRLKGLLS